MNPILQINNLSKHYGKLKALNDFSLEIQEGNVYGILGPNGSGKTTTLGIILDVIKKTSGEYFWFGKEPDSDTRKKIGSILEYPAFYPYLSAVQNLQVIATIKEKGSDRIDEVLRQVGLYDRRHDAFRKYSLGMKQRLSIASALLTDPPVLILDEPTNGLDPQGIAEIRELIIKVAAEGKTIIMASHILDEVQRVCTHFTVLKQGKKIYEGSVKEAMQQKQNVEVAADNMQDLTDVLNSSSLISELIVESGKLSVKLHDGATSTALNKYLIDKGIIVSHLAERTHSLEKKFLKILEESHD